MVRYSSTNLIKTTAKVLETPMRPYTRKANFLMLHHSTRTPSFPTNLEDYAPWVATYGLTAPYGQCQCGCGQDTEPSDRTRVRGGVIKGHPLRFITSHSLNHISLEDAFWKHVDIGDAEVCWLWLKKVSNPGYGQINYRNQRYLAHRVCFELHFGPIPAGLHVLHKCDNRACVNPRHLFLGTNNDNIADMMSKRRNTHGECHPDAKLNATDVIRIREMWHAGTSTRALASLYGVSQGAIYQLCNRKTWKHVP